MGLRPTLLMPKKSKRPLIRLYESALKNEAGPAGPTMSLADLEKRFPDAAVKWDHVPDTGGKNVHFRLTGDGKNPQGTVLAQVSKGGGWWVWSKDREEWLEAPKPGGKNGQGGTGKTSFWREGPPSGNEVNRNALQQLYNHFSTTFGEYTSGISSAVNAAFGPGWQNLIDGVYGKGSTKRMLQDLWKNFWTDNEAIHEVSHYYDVAQQAAGQKAMDRSSGERGRDAAGGRNYSQDVFRRHAREAIASYPMKIGPCYDGDGQTNPWNDDANIRRQRITAADEVAGYFATHYCSH